MGLFEIQTVQQSASQQIKYGKNHRDGCPHLLTGSPIDLGKLWFFLSQAPPDQCHRRHLHAVSKGERQAHHIHAYLVGREGIGPQFGRHHRHSHKSDPQKDLLQKYVGTDPENAF